MIFYIMDFLLYHKENDIYWILDSNEKKKISGYVFTLGGGVVT